MHVNRDVGQSLIFCRNTFLISDGQIHCNLSTKHEHGCKLATIQLVTQANTTESAQRVLNVHIFGNEHTALASETLLKKNPTPLNGR